jgi:hypothetical protein
MYCWPVSPKACDLTPPLIDTRGAAIPSSVRKRQAAVQYLQAAGRSTDRRERERLRLLAAKLILPR